MEKSNLEKVNKVCEQIKVLEQTIKIGGYLSPSELIVSGILENCSAEVCLRIAKAAMDKSFEKAKEPIA